MQTKVLARSVALAFLALGTAHAAPLSHEFTGVADNVNRTSGTAITGSFNHDTYAYAFAGFDYAGLSQRTASEPTRVPRPASLLMLGLGLIGFGLVRRRLQSV